MIWQYWNNYIHKNLPETNIITCFVYLFTVIILPLKFNTLKPSNTIYLLKIQVLCVTGWVDHHVSKECSAFFFKGQTVKDNSSWTAWLQQIKLLFSVKMSESIHPATQCHTSEDLNPHPHCYKNLRTYNIIFIHILHILAYYDHF